MSRCFCFALVAFQNKWFGQEILKNGQHPTIELKQVRLPVSIGTNTIDPSVIWIFNLLIIRKEIGVGIHDGTISAKHQQSSVGQAILTCFPVFSEDIDFFEKLVFWQSVPYMVRVPLLKLATVLHDRGRIQIPFAVMFHDTAVHGVGDIGIREHAIYLLAGAMVISIQIASICSCIGVEPTIYRPQTSIHSWDIEKQEIGSFKFYGLYIIFF